MDQDATAATPRLKAPPGACDTHMHFYGARERYPLAPSAIAEPPYADVPMYRREIMARLGTERVVIVQPSAYGTDNRCTLDGLAALGPAARAIAVVTPRTPEAELRDLDAKGVRGARFLMFGRAVLSWDDLAPLAARVAPLGWHVQLQFDGRELPEREAAIRALPGRFVIDHNGKYLEPVAPDHTAVASLKRLLDSGRCWVKASAPYETSRTGPPTYADVGAIASALIRHAPERILWASNWPHPGFTGRTPDDATLLDLLLDWAPDETTRRRILVDNPAELYGF